MERIHALIDKLYQQRRENASPVQLMLTAQMLHSELSRLQQRNGTLGTAKVAVTLPVNMNFSEEVQRPAPAPPPEHERFVPKPAPEPEPVAVSAPPAPEPVAKPKEQAREFSVPKEYVLQKPVFPIIVEEPEPEPPVMQEPAPVYQPAPQPVQQVLNPAFQSVAETASPTLRSRELHEVIGDTKESLNDRLKQEKTEVAHTLKDTPIRDLRKGIGINDRFAFVNELFRGDEAMYERSIKTINGFHILSEAEYWINRELKFKLGWNDNKETVQHFYQLVRRRFS